MYATITVFTTDEIGRERLANFQKIPTVEIVHFDTGEIVNTGKKEPAVFVLWIDHDKPKLPESGA